AVGSGLRDRGRPRSDHATDRPCRSGERQNMPDRPGYRGGMDVAVARPPSGALTGAVGIGVAVGVYGISFGVLAVASGLSPAQACVMSMLVFTGASQFAFVGVIAAGGGAFAAMGPAVMLAVRNAAYGLSLTSILPARLRDRALAAHLVIDETTAMARAQSDPDAARRAFLATGLSVWVFWNAGTLAGALLGG